MIADLSVSGKYQSVNKNPQSLNGGSIVAKVSGALLARAYLPAPAQIKQCLKYLDFGIKLEILLYEISSCMYWVSLSEFGLFLFGLFLFFADSSEMGAFWIHVMHLGRAIVGLIIVKKLPTSHQIAESLTMPGNDDTKLTFDKIADYIMKAFRQSLTHFSKSSGTMLMIYMILTIICTLLDLVGFIIALT